MKEFNYFCTISYFCKSAIVHNQIKKKNLLTMNTLITLVPKLTLPKMRCIKQQCVIHFFLENNYRNRLISAGLNRFSAILKI